MARLLPKNASAIFPSASRACASVATMGSPLRLPLVMTSGTSTQCMSRCCTGVEGSMMPSSGSAPAMPGAIAVPGLRCSKTMGRARCSSSAASFSFTTHSSRACARSRTMMASGLVGRCLRPRSARTACSSNAEHDRCHPPSPLMASTWPAERRVAASSMSASDCSRVRCAAGGTSAPDSSKTACSRSSDSHRRGPHAKHASGWAW